ncbi:tetratricopeptide repeat protein, partial [candidate division KSB1 bacterium]
QLDNLSYLATINWIMGHKEEAVHFFREILHYHKKSLAGRINLAIAYSQLENYDSARELLLDARRDEYVDTDIDELLSYINSNKKPPFKGFLSFDYFISNLKDVFYRPKVK